MHTAGDSLLKPGIIDLWFAWTASGLLMSFLPVTVLRSCASVSQSYMYDSVDAMFRLSILAVLQHYGHCC